MRKNNIVMYDEHLVCMKSYFTLNISLLPTEPVVNNNLKYELIR